MSSRDQYRVKKRSWTKKGRMLTQLTRTQVCLRLSKVRFNGMSRERGRRILQHGQEICYSSDGDIARMEWYIPSRESPSAMSD